MTRLQRILGHLLPWIRQHLVKILIIVCIGGWIAYGCRASKLPAAQPALTKGPVVPGQGIEEAKRVQQSLLFQEQFARAEEERKKDHVVIHELRQALKTQEQDRQAAERERQVKADAHVQEQKQQLDAFLKQAQSSMAVKQAPPPPPKPIVKPVTKQGTGTPDQPTLPMRHGNCADDPTQPCVRILNMEKAGSSMPVPPVTARAETPFLPPGSFAEGRLLTGALVTSRAGVNLPVLLTITSPFTAPFVLQGAGRNPRQTAIPLQGCFVLGEAEGDMSSGRVWVRLKKLSCVFPDLATFVQTLDPPGYTTGVDGTLGIVGRVETRETAMLAKAFFTTILAGASTAGLTSIDSLFNKFRRTVVVAQPGSIASGSSSGDAVTHRLVDYFLQEAAKLGPVIWVEAGTPVKLVLQDGIALDGFPASVLLTAKGLP